jgi:hypothetical protein
MMPAVPWRPAAALLGSGTALGFEQRRVVIGHAALHRYDAREWSEALVVVERGVLELEWSGGARLCFEPGDTLSLSSLRLRGLRGAGAGPTVLVVLSRVGGGAGVRGVLQ